MRRLIPVLGLCAFTAFGMDVSVISQTYQGSSEYQQDLQEGLRKFTSEEINLCTRSVKADPNVVNLINVLGLDINQIKDVRIFDACSLISGIDMPEDRKQYYLSLISADTEDLLELLQNSSDFVDSDDNPSDICKREVLKMFREGCKRSKLCKEILVALLAQNESKDFFSCLISWDMNLEKFSNMNKQKLKFMCSNSFMAYPPNMMEFNNQCRLTVPSFFPSGDLEFYSQPLVLAFLHECSHLLDFFSEALFELDQLEGNSALWKDIVSKFVDAELDEAAFDKVYDIAMENRNKAGGLQFAFSIENFISQRAGGIPSPLDTTAMYKKIHEIHADIDESAFYSILSNAINFINKPKETQPSSIEREVAKMLQDRSYKELKDQLLNSKEERAGANYQFSYTEFWQGHGMLLNDGVLYINNYCDTHIALDMGEPIRADYSGYYADKKFFKVDRGIRYKFPESVYDVYLKFWGSSLDEYYKRIIQ